jgi:hypothetical protein
MIDLIFRWCVWILVLVAGVLGTSYEALNVWIFVILWPLITAGLVVVIVRQQREIDRLRRQFA